MISRLVLAVVVALASVPAFAQATGGLDIGVTDTLGGAAGTVTTQICDPNNGSGGNCSSGSVGSGVTVPLSNLTDPSRASLSISDVGLFSGGSSGSSSGGSTGASTSAVSAPLSNLTSTTTPSATIKDVGAFSTGGAGQ